LTIEQERDDVAHLDGDPYPLGRTIEVTINPLSLKVIVPNE
jgi:hypothetical protein